MCVLNYSFNDDDFVCVLIASLSSPRCYCDMMKFCSDCKINKLEELFIFFTKSKNMIDQTFYCGVFKKG